MILKELADANAVYNRGEMISQPLQKSMSVGNLSRVTATTADGTDSCSVFGGGIYDDVHDDHRLTVFQIDSWSEESKRIQVGKQNIISPATSGDNDIRVVISSLLSLASDDDNDDEEEQDGSDMALPDGIPTEVLILTDPTETSARGSLMWNQVNNDDDCANNYKGTTDAQAELYHMFLQSYKQRLQSTSQENEALHELLRQARQYAEDLLNQREELVQVIEEMEDDASHRNDQQLFLKVIMLFSLLLFLSGGSSGFLVAAVGLQLLATFINLVI
jgi:hypothetical protein